MSCIVVCGGGGHAVGMSSARALGTHTQAAAAPPPLPTQASSPFTLISARIIDAVRTAAASHPQVRSPAPPLVFERLSFLFCVAEAPHVSPRSCVQQQQRPPSYRARFHPASGLSAVAPPCSSPNTECPYHLFLHCHPPPPLTPATQEHPYWPLRLTSYSNSSNHCCCCGSDLTMLMATVLERPNPGGTPGPTVERDTPLQFIVCS